MSNQISERRQRRGSGLEYVKLSVLTMGGMYLTNFSHSLRHSERAPGGLRGSNNIPRLRIGLHVFLRGDGSMVGVIPIALGENSWVQPSRHFSQTRMEAGMCLTLRHKVAPSEGRS